MNPGALGLALFFVACGGKTLAGDTPDDGGGAGRSAVGMGGAGPSNGGVVGVAGLAGMQGGAPPAQPSGDHAGHSGQGGDGVGGAPARDSAPSAPSDPVLECKYHQPANCEGQAVCFCTSCRPEAMNCQGDVGCLEILRCAIDGSCVDLEDCIPQCDPVFRQYPKSVPIAIGLNDCARRGGCTALCQAPTVPDAGPPPVEGDGGVACTRPPLPAGAKLCGGNDGIDAGSCEFGCEDDERNAYKSKCKGGVCECAYNAKPICTCSMPMGSTCSSCCPTW